MVLSPSIIHPAEFAMKFFYVLVSSSLLALAGCTGAAFEKQCDSHTELSAQLSCMDTAFFVLESEIVTSRGDRERGDRDLREELEYCAGLRERFADEGWAEENREEYGGLLRRCIGLWDRLEDDRDDWDEDDWDEDDRDDWDEDDWDEDDWDEDDDWDDEDEREGDKGDWDDEDEREGDDDLREDAGDRGELGEVRDIRERTRGEVERIEDSAERRDRVREGLAEGRRWVDRLLGAVRGEDSRDTESIRGDEERPR